MTIDYESDDGGRGLGQRGREGRGDNIDVMVITVTTDDDGNLMVRVMLIKVMITDDSEDGDDCDD